MCGAGGEVRVSLKCHRVDENSDSVGIHKTSLGRKGGTVNKDGKPSSLKDSHTCHTDLPPPPPPHSGPALSPEEPLVLIERRR